MDLRLAYRLLALALAMAVIVLAAWVLETTTDGSSIWGFLGFVAGCFAVTELIRRLVSRLQRRTDASR